MSEEDKVNSLEDLVLGWVVAVGVPELYESWIKELRSFGVGNIQALEENAGYDDTWKELTEGVSGGLRIKLRKWYEGKYHKSKFWMIMS
jgi:hypothetical protein